MSSGNHELIASAHFGLARVAGRGGDINQAVLLGEESLAGFKALGHFPAEKVSAWLNELDTDAAGSR